MGRDKDPMTETIREEKSCQVSRIISIVFFIVLILRLAVKV